MHKRCNRVEPCLHLPVNMHQEREQPIGRCVGFTSAVSPLTLHRSIGKGDKVICKQPSTTSVLTEKELELVYKRETIAYEQVLPSMGASSLAAKFFASSSGLIILQDLVDEGFSSADRLAGLTPRQMDLALKALADFHASSMTLRYQRSEVWNSLVPELYDFRPDIGAYKSGLENSLQTALMDLQNSKEKNVAEILSSTSLTVATENPDPVFQVICHGDYWSNNLMFRNESSIKIIDFQNLSVGPLYKDLLTLVSSSSQFDTDILRCYETYFQHLKAAAGNLAEFPSYTEFMAHLHKGLGYGFLTGLLYLGARLIPQVSNFSAGADFRVSQLPGYRERLFHLIDMYRGQGLLGL